MRHDIFIGNNSFYTKLYRCYMEMRLMVVQILQAFELKTAPYNILIFKIYEYSYANLDVSLSLEY